VKLLFAGANGPWWPLLFAAAAAVAAWWLYRPDVRARGGIAARMLPALRALAVFLLVFLLAEPVLHRRHTEGQLSRLLVVVDASRSMDIADRDATADRKILAAVRYGWIGKDGFPSELLGPAEMLAALRRETPGAEGLAARLPDRVGDVRRALEGLPEDVRKRLGDRGDERFRKELVEPAERIAKRAGEKSPDAAVIRRETAEVLQRAGDWERAVRAAFREQIQQLAAVEGGPVRAAVERFDATTRWQRLQAALLDGGTDAMLARLSQRHDVEVLAAREEKPVSLWGGADARAGEVPAAFEILPDAPGTDFAGPLREFMAAEAGKDSPQAQRAAVIFTDGRNNRGGSPLEMVRLLAGRGVPVFAIGFGSERPPRDIAAVAAKVPPSVFAKDRLRGELTIADHLPAGQAFTVRVRSGGETVWEKQLVSDNSGERRIPFDFAVEKLAEGALKERAAGVSVASVPLDFEASIETAAEVASRDNDAVPFRVKTVTQRRRALLADARPRWETRYLRNLLERDGQWEVNALPPVADLPEPAWERGEKAGTFPSEARLLNAYDLVLLGDVPRELVREEEIGWLKDFVEKRGGGLLLVDGPRDALRDFQDTALAPLLPVRWKDRGGIAPPVRLVLTEAGAALDAFQLDSDPVRNRALWASFRAPHWVAAVEAERGAEVLAEAELGDARIPAIVTRRSGAGGVVYHGFDESWRWRFGVGEEFFARYWNQMTAWIAEPPFAVQDDRVALDVGAVERAPGEAASLRIRLRDERGLPVVGGDGRVVIYRDGRRMGSLPLVADEGGGGVFRAQTGPLASGNYEFGVERAELPESSRAVRAGLIVREPFRGELALLHADEELLGQIAQATGGHHLREEESAALPGLLEPLTGGKVVETEAALGRSWWWFWLVIGLFTAEWLLRKRWGLV
jgi:uncharacterized membrane protein